MEYSVVKELTYEIMSSSHEFVPGILRRFGVEHHPLKDLKNIDNFITDNAVSVKTDLRFWINYLKFASTLAMIECAMDDKLKEYADWRMLNSLAESYIIRTLSKAGCL